MANNSILVFSEDAVILKQLLGKARQQADLAGAKVYAVAAAQDAEAVKTAGADVVYAVDGDLYNPEVTAAVLMTAFDKVQPVLLVVSATKTGMETAPRVADRYHAGYATWAIDFSLDGASQATTAQCMLYTGSGMATYQFKPGQVVLTSAGNVYEPLATPFAAAAVEKLEYTVSKPALEVLDYKAKPSSGVRLEDCKMIVDIGQGIKQKEDLAMINDLAGILGAQLACSRPIASDRDWFPEWLGLSGAHIKPELCLAVGISGAIQHIIGIRDSHLIAAVNNDEGAAIFNQADYGVLADLYEFIPALLERMKARGITSA